jgi:hypothetical protein
MISPAEQGACAQTTFITSHSVSEIRGTRFMCLAFTFVIFKRITLVIDKSQQESVEFFCKRIYSNCGEEAAAPAGEMPALRIHHCRSLQAPKLPSQMGQLVRVWVVWLV